MRTSLLLLTLTLVACGGRDRKPACGFTAIAGVSLLLNEFGVPNQTLSEAPRRVPERLVVRLAAGPAYPAVVGQADSGWVVGVEGTLPATVKPGFGVLVLDPQGKSRGVVLFESDPVAGAPVIGKITMGAATLPLLGIQLEPGKYEDQRCPLFPDSVLQ